MPRRKLSPFNEKDWAKVRGYCDPSLRKAMANAIKTLRKHGKKVAPEKKLLYAHPVLRTKRVRAFAARFPKTERGIKAMIDRVHSFLVKEKPSIARKVYGIQTVDDVIATGKIPTPKDPKSKEFLWGCRMQAYTLRTILVEKDIPATVFRSFAEFDLGDIGAPHSYVIFDLGGKKFLADPFSSIPKRRMRQIGETLRKRIVELMVQGRFVMETPRFVTFEQFRKEKI